MQELGVDAGRDPTPKHFPDSRIFTSMFNHIGLDKGRKEQMSMNSAQEVADFSKDLNPGNWCFIGERSEQSWNYHPVADNRGKWDANTESMTDIFSQLRCAVCPAAERKKSTIHCTADPENVQMPMKLCCRLISCVCVFPSVAQILDDQPEFSNELTGRDLNVSEMETSRHPPRNPVANNAGGEFHAKSRR